MAPGRASRQGTQMKVGKMGETEHVHVR
jgi:hypothetical protein